MTLATRIMLGLKQSTTQIKSSNVKTSRQTDKMTCGRVEASRNIVNNLHLRKCPGGYLATRALFYCVFYFGIILHKLLSFRSMSCSAS